MKGVSKIFIRTVLSNVYHSDVIWRKMYQSLSSEEGLHTRTLRKTKGKKRKMGKKRKIKYTRKS